MEPPRVRAKLDERSRRESAKDCDAVWNRPAAARRDHALLRIRIG